VIGEHLHDDDRIVNVSRIALVNMARWVMEFFSIGISREYFMHIHVFDLRRSGARYGARYGVPFRGQQPPSRSCRDGDTESRRRSAENWERHKAASSPQRFLHDVVPCGMH